MLYIVGHEKYRQYLEEGFYKYILKIYTPRFRIKELAPLTRTGQKVGSIVGMNLRELDYEDEEVAKQFISSIKSLGKYNYKTIYMEDMEKLSSKTIKAIELETGLKFPLGIDIRLYNLPLILARIGELKKEDTREKELLIICSEKDLTLRAIDSVGNMFNFISLLGLEDNEYKDIYETILASKGISIFQSKNKNLDLKVYDIIVNFSNDYKISEGQVARKTIIIDYSIGKVFKELKSGLIISDFNLRTEGYNIESNKLVDKNIPSSLYEVLIGEKNQEFCQVLVKDEFYYLEDYISSSPLVIKGHF